MGSRHVRSGKESRQPRGNRRLQQETDRRLDRRRDEPRRPPQEVRGFRMESVRMQRQRHAASR